MKRLALALALATCAGTALSVPAASAAPREPEPEVASGSSWTVTRVAGGFEVTLELDRPAPVAAGAPTLAVDGRVLGPATESADGRSLTLVTTDPSVVDATEVTTDAFGAPAADTDVRTPSTVPAGDPTVLPADPSRHGDHEVLEAEYDFGDQAVPLLNIGGIRGEMTGKIYLPDGRGEAPVVVFLHGRHTSCYGSGAANPARWPCLASPDSTQQRLPIPSHLGYEEPARALASNGYAVISISANAINANDNQLSADHGAQARGQLVLDTLRMLEQADRGERVVFHDAFTDRDVSLDQALTGDLRPADLVRRLDLDDVGLMGHSRGGEGVVAAATLNDARPVSRQYGIDAVLPLAPVAYDRITLPNAVTATILPYCDGDVENLMGQHIVDDSRHAFEDDVLRSAVLVMGANHNYFNTVWTPGLFPAATADDWASFAPDSDDPTCDASADDTTRLTPAQQRAVGVAYLAGFFRLTLGGETEFQPLFDGSDVVAPSTASFASLTVAATQPARSRTDLATFEGASDAVRATGDVTAEVCASMGGAGGVTLPQPRPFCATTVDQAALPHWSPALWAPNVPASPMLHMTWDATAGDVRVAVPRGRRDIADDERISVRMAADASVATGTDVVISVVDGDGRTWSAPVSELNPDAVGRLPGREHPWLRKIILQQVTIPTSSLTGLDLTDVREVRFTPAVGADGTPSGGVFLSDLSVENPAVGGRRPARQATVDIASTRVEEGAGPGTAQVAAVLSERVRHPVTAYVSVFGAAEGRAGATMRQVTFAPGQVCVPVGVPTYGDTLPGATASTSFKVSATNVSGAVMGDAGFGTLTVREDDGVTGGTPAPEVGEQGDVCAEYTAATGRPGALRVTGQVRAGSTVEVGARGYRAGESVEFTLGATSLGRAVADRRGAVSFEAPVPADAPTGRATLTATGAGSGRTTEAEVRIRR
ncbi:hypothetical protein [Streptomyces hainanensis]|uniref:Alpha/beta hydrolase n=1 Tax=Streptomyces hainanensis TaxID=402648 RepID=A0A4R4TRT0_9ACTN|nr:hypothetical protein [Streptomyces hainanensis]TDC78102.1 hypothetical protein E1283_05730 [Streptomyces hainanensis]